MSRGWRVIVSFVAMVAMFVLGRVSAYQNEEASAGEPWVIAFIVATAVMALMVQEEDSL